jgi:hypothetical protein
MLLAGAEVVTPVVATVDEAGVLLAPELRAVAALVVKPVEVAEAALTDEVVVVVHLLEVLEVFREEVLEVFLVEVVQMVDDLPVVLP